MDAPTPSKLSNPINQEINLELTQTYKNILRKHLDDRNYKEDKVKIWANNILLEAKEHFIKKYKTIAYFFLLVYILKMFILGQIQLQFH